MKYGWLPDHPDPRDRPFRATARNIKSLPSLIDWSPNLPPIFDQGQIGSCTAQALIAAFTRLTTTPRPYSRLFLYYNEREILGTTASDSGAMIRDGVKSLIVDGCCPEYQWPYDPAQVLTRPSDSCYHVADTVPLLAYHRVDNTSLDDILEALTIGPVVAGFTVFQSFESTQVTHTGIVPMPAPAEEALGGHAILIVGYDISNNQFIVRNSWGIFWGQRGHCRFPFTYLADPTLADDFWLLTKAT